MLVYKIKKQNNDDSAVMKLSRIASAFLCPEIHLSKRYKVDKSELFHFPGISLRTASNYCKSHFFRYNCLIR